MIEPDDIFTAEDFVIFDVDGLLLSSSPVHGLVDCVASVRRGFPWVDPGVRLLLGHTNQQVLNLEELSSREYEVARLAASGLSNKMIARKLNVTDGTVKMHMHHILAKLRLGSRSELSGLTPTVAPRFE